MSFNVKFWGVRGSIACPSPQHIGFGGNTSCVEVNAGGERLIFDAGTGLKGLGEAMVQEEGGSAYILLSHTHWDHINGFPFFTPAYMPNFKLKVMAGHVRHEGGILKLFRGQMAQPFFPIPLEAMQSDMVFEDFTSGEEIVINDQVIVKTAALHHPNGATGYRVEYKGRAVCYVTDTEHIPGETNENVVELIRDADLVIYDCTYTEEEFVSKVGWGHSTWEEGIRLCKLANARMMAIFHHDPSHTDDVMEQIERNARNEWNGAIVAREQMKITIV
ncbi:MBL fold metallo-hydrolase [Curvivirga aplysinae]|uniref:MBL fold metallo-hydrolase n=1 Tax=Curvivirga aplysinae TaxID=2529852 RepID=UPI0012BCD43D|nr:MBL fold metallo-hydrolase [Curvivirga aplysinae]MTI10873.1 MBL fold metallo-hydrolase [Curvivirga aplysinae]